MTRPVRSSRSEPRPVAAVEGALGWPLERVPSWPGRWLWPAGSCSAGRYGDRGPRVLVERARRSRRVASLAARRALALARLRSRRAGEEELDEFHVHTAEQVFELLGGMKGAIMKLGQMLSVVADGLPEVYQQALRGLQQSAPPMAPSLVAHVIRAELGQPPERAFFEFSPEPVAAASIGQVHRAKLFDGTPVAVKVQYPGVGVAIRADLDNAFLLYSAARAIAPGIDPEPVVSELRERMGEELDYRIEADNQEEFRAAYEGHPWVRIPVVHRETSTERVLVTEWVSGRPFYDLLDQPQDLRDRVGEQLFRFWSGSISKMLLFNADPHPGNYFFEEPGAGADPPESGEGSGSSTSASSSGSRPWRSTSSEGAGGRPAQRGRRCRLDAIVRHGWLRPGTKIDQKRMVELARLSVLPLVDHRPVHLHPGVHGRDGRRHVQHRGPLRRRDPPDDPAPEPADPHPDPPGPRWPLRQARGGPGLGVDPRRVPLRRRAFDADGTGGGRMAETP